MTLEGLTCHVISVLRRHRKHNSSLAQVKREALQSEMRFSQSIALRDFDTIQPVISYYSAPNRIVEVENQSLSAFAANSGDHPSNMVGIKRNKLVGKRKLTD